MVACGGGCPGGERDRVFGVSHAPCDGRDAQAAPHVPEIVPEDRAVLPVCLEEPVGRKIGIGQTKARVGGPRIRLDLGAPAVNHAQGCFPRVPAHSRLRAQAQQRADGHRPGGPQELVDAVGRGEPLPRRIVAGRRLALEVLRNVGCGHRAPGARQGIPLPRVTA